MNYWFVKIIQIRKTSIALCSGKNSSIAQNEQRIDVAFAICDRKLY
ncbi:MULTISPECIES: hypothetical protein [Leptolyngbya]|nr:MULTISPECIES: hypothetical protein [Leptolyngbya]MBD2374784.1 hypothetical protein [Leptolyngbya sp. FACHB-238]MBD2399206.1 hypothetical protein [Leptolyngbya sp. FACHB-239]